MEYIFATAGLDGIVGIFSLWQGANIDEVKMTQNYVLQVNNTEDPILRPKKFYQPHVHRLMKILWQL